jgi:hypothetical protein
MAGHLPDGHLPSGHLPEGHLPEGDSSGTTPSTSRRFPVRPQRRRFYIRTSPSGDAVTSEYLFDPVVKDPGSTRKVVLDLYEIAAAKWQPNEEVAVNEFCRPRIPNGFSDEATTAGLTSGREPLWPTEIGLTKADGGAIWTCRAASSNGINPVSDPEAASDPTGLTIGDVAVSENCKILATYSGGTDGQDYDAVFEWTLEGVPWIGRQRVQVRRQ